MADDPNAAGANAAAAVQAAAAAASTQAVVKPDFTTMKLDGETVPEKLRGKTVAEIAAVLASIESEKTKSEQKVKEWNTWYKKEVLDKQAEPAAGEDNGRAASRAGGADPRSAFEAEQVTALGQLFDTAMAPMVKALSGIYKESIKASRPDFKDFEERAQVIFDQMPYTHKIDPEYGWTFAYNMARAEKLGKEPPPAPNAVAGGGAAPVVATGEEPLTPVEKLWADRFKMDAKEYRKYSIPRED